MEALFYLPTDSSEDPPQTSLFNVTTLKQLISLGQSTVNIISSKNQVFNAEELDPAWEKLAKQLQLTEVDDDDMGVKRTYLLWLWMQTAWN